MATNPTTYRVSLEVDTELRRLAGIHGGVDKALRVLFGWASPLASQKDAKTVTVEDVARQPDSIFTPAIEEKIKRNLTPRYKGPLLKPSERK